MTTYTFSDISNITPSGYPAVLTSSTTGTTAQWSLQYPHADGNYPDFEWDAANATNATLGWAVVGTNNGTISYNSTSGKIEYYINSYWIHEFDPTEGRTAFTPATFGQVGHILTNTGHSSNITSSNWECVSVTNNEYLYRRWSGSSVGTVTAYDIKYDVTNDEWLDAVPGISNWPSQFGTSTTDSTAITPTIASQYLYLWDPNNNGFICELENDGYTTGSGSGGSNSGPGPMSVVSSVRKVFTNFW